MGGISRNEFSNDCEGNCAIDAHAVLRRSGTGTPYLDVPRARLYDQLNWAPAHAQSIPNTNVSILLLLLLCSFAFLIPSSSSFSLSRSRSRSYLHTHTPPHTHTHTHTLSDGPPRAEEAGSRACVCWMQVVAV